MAADIFGCISCHCAYMYIQSYQKFLNQMMLSDLKDLLMMGIRLMPGRSGSEALYHKGYLVTHVYMTRHICTTNGW